MKTPFTLPKMTADEKARRSQLTRAVRPKLASTIVLTHGDPKDPHILMGQRAKRHDFMPSVYVFPGGRVDRADSYAPFTGALSRRTQHILEAALSPRRARALVLASVRESWEETGFMMGIPAPFKGNINNASWDEFRQAGIVADLSSIEVFGRAVTPPQRHKRFDTWFFHHHISGPRPTVSDSHELQNCLLYTSPSPRDKRQTRMPSSA